MYRYILHEAVKADYDEAYEWYEKKLEGLGERFLSAIHAKLDEIAKSPEAFGERSKKGYGKHRLIFFLILLFIKFIKWKE